MSKELETRLRAHLSRHEGKSDLLFVNQRGRPLSANKLREKSQAAQTNQTKDPLAIVGKTCYNPPS